jgi:hypothetical protein
LQWFLERGRGAGEEVEAARAPSVLLGVLDRERRSQVSTDFFLAGNFVSLALVLVYNRLYPVLRAGLLWLLRGQ